MPPQAKTPLQKRRALAVKRGVTSNHYDFSHICRQKPDRIGIVAEGDSWFAYPRKWMELGADINIVHHLQSRVSGTGKVNLLRLASNGDEAVDMTSGKQFKFLYKTLKRNARHIRLLLFSGGGNDIIGKDSMPPLLKKFQPGFSFEQCIEMDRFEEKMASIILSYRRLVHLCEDVIPDAHIITHTYDITQPWDQGAEFFWGIIKTKPWIYPYLKDREIPVEHHLPIMKFMLGEFSKRLISMASEPSLGGRLVVVKTQGTLTPGSKSDWLNEIHPTEKGFKKIFEKIYARMKDLEPDLPSHN